MQVEVTIKFKPSGENAAKSATTLKMATEINSPSDTVRSITQALKEHALDDLQIPLFGEGRVKVIELADATVDR